MYPEYIRKMLHIKAHFRKKIFHFFYIVNQKKNKKQKKFVNHCPLPILPFSPNLFTCIYIKNIM